MSLTLPVSAHLFGRSLRDTAGRLRAPAAVFGLIIAIGAVAISVGTPPAATVSGSTTTFSPSDPDDEALSRLENYTRSIGAENPASTPATPELLPDVDTMIERLAARLETVPEDVDGWRMLGWSYFNTGRYDLAAFAYSKAVELDPNSSELRRSYEQAKAKAADPDTPETASARQAAAADAGGGPSLEAMPPRERDAAIRAMVEGLADRLERAPRDVDGWTRLMRSRVVLGERDVAATALQKALEVFKDDPAASSTIRAAAIELGLKAE